MQLQNVWTRLKMAGAIDDQCLEGIGEESEVVQSVLVEHKVLSWL